MGKTVRQIDRWQTDWSADRHLKQTDDFGAAGRNNQSECWACMADGPPWSARTEPIFSQGSLLLLLSTAVNKHLLHNKLTWLKKTRTALCLFYDKELDYGSWYYLSITVLHILIAGSRGVSRWLEKIWCLLFDYEKKFDAGREVVLVWWLIC